MRFCGSPTRSKGERYPADEAVDLAVERCLKEDVLTDVWKAHRKEVVTMFSEEYNEELDFRALREEGFEDGYAEGEEKSEERLNALNIRLFQDNRLENLLRSTVDPEFQKKLLKEYHSHLFHKTCLPFHKIERPAPPYPLLRNRPGKVRRPTPFRGSILPRQSPLYGNSLAIRTEIG